jgi:hypothetical protein
MVGDTLQGTKNGLKYPNIYEDFNELQKSVEECGQQFHSFEIWLKFP